MMDSSRWIGGDVRHDRAGRRTARRRASTGLKPACTALDDRQLLSMVAAPAVLPTPPAVAVGNAAAELNGLDPTTFAQFQRALSQAEGHSRATAAEAGALAQDEAAIDQAIAAAGLDKNATATAVNRVQNVVADAFLAGPYQASASVTRRRDQEMARLTRNGQAVLVQPHNRRELRGELNQILAGVPGATPLIPGTVSQMEAVARSARVSPQVHDALGPDWLALEYDLGPNPYTTNLGPGAGDRDPLYVYYDGQVANFIKG